MTEQDKNDIKEALDLITNCLEAEEIDNVPIPSDWLAEHDKQIRENTINECISTIRNWFDIHKFFSYTSKEVADIIIWELKKTLKV